MAPTSSAFHDDSGLDDYTNDLETRLSIKTNQVDQITKLYHALEARFLTLEQGLALKEEQLHTEFGRSEALRQDGLEWQKRYSDIEQENNRLRQALMEQHAVVERYSMYMEGDVEQPMRFQSSPEIAERGPEGQGPNRAYSALANKCQKMAQELIDAKQKTLLLEEQLRIRSRTDPFGQEVAPGEALAGGTFASHALQPWMCGSAADRICAAEKILTGAWQRTVSRSFEKATSQSLPDAQEAHTTESQVEELHKGDSRRTSVGSDQTQNLRLPPMVHSSSGVLERSQNQSPSAVNSQELKEESVRREWTDRNILTWHAGNPTPVTPVSNSTNTPSSTTNSSILTSAVAATWMPGTPTRPAKRTTKAGTHAPLSSVVYTSRSSNPIPGSAPPPSTKSSTANNAPRI